MAKEKAAEKPRDESSSIQRELAGLRIDGPVVRRAEEKWQAKEYYAELAKRYNFDYRPVSWERESQYLAGIRSLNIDPKMKLCVLEAGPGDGLLAIHLANFYPNCDVLGVDLSGQYVKEAEKARKRYRLENVRFKKGNAVNVKGKFDIIIASQSILSYSPNLADDMHKLTMKLRPGAKFFAVGTHVMSFAEMKASYEKVKGKYKSITDPKSSRDMFADIGLKTYFPEGFVQTIESSITVPRPGGGREPVFCYDVKVIETAFESTPEEYIAWFRQFGEPFKVKPEFEAMKKTFYKEVGDDMRRDYRGRPLYRTAAAIHATACAKGDIPKDPSRGDAKRSEEFVKLLNSRRFKYGDRIVELAKQGQEEIYPIVDQAFSENPPESSRTLVSRIRKTEALKTMEVVDPTQGKGLPLKDGSVSALIIARWPWKPCENPGYDLIKECHRVLEPGGLLIMVVLLNDTYEPANRVFVNKIASVTKYQKYLGPVKNIYDMAELRIFDKTALLEALRNSGFRVPKTTSIQAFHPISADDYSRQCDVFFNIDSWRLPGASADVRAEIKDRFHFSLTGDPKAGYRVLYPGASLFMPFAVKKGRRAFPKPAR